MTDTPTLTDAWRAVEAANAALAHTTLRGLFAGDPTRFARFSRSLDDLTVDFSKERIDAAALTALLALHDAAGVAAKRDAMAAGAAINATEGRAVLHMALRGSVAPDVAGVGEVASVREAFLGFAEDVRTGRHAAADGRPFDAVLNIGIGGSDLGPAMAARALAPDADGPAAHFVSNVDGAHFTDVAKGLDPARTLVVVASKTFTTQETMTNAAAARDWLRGALGAAGDGHLAAVSTNLPACAAFGIPASRVFGFWDWVGGRYSLWGAIGLPLAIAVGADRFRAMLDGAAAMDRHFLTAPPEDNLPVLLGLIGVWRRSVMGCATAAVIPYDQRLDRFPAYLQQLMMESNGKGVGLDGAPLRRPACPVIWGEPGTNAQHSFFQMLHQGLETIPVDFILAAEPREALGDHHAKLTANCLAQSAALAFGMTADEARDAMLAKGADAAEAGRLAPHRAFPGDRPSTTLIHRRLDPFSLGRLVALYEHRTFVEGAIWGVNPFDQFGVELGKRMASDLLPAAQGGAAAGFDGSTQGLLAALRG